MEEIGLVEAITAVREELVQAVLAGAQHPLRFPLEGVQLTFQVGVTRDSAPGGKLRFSILELGYQQRHQTQSVHTVTLNLGAPRDDSGTPFKVTAHFPEKP
jgi:hypothetical protein